MNTETKILVCYNEPTRFYENYVGKDCPNIDENIDLSESEFAQNLEIILESLRTNYKHVDSFPVNNNVTMMLEQLDEICPDIIYNFVESIDGNSYYESYIAGIFDLLGYSYTGNNALTLGNCLIKSRTKQILTASNIRTPKYFVAPNNPKFSFIDHHLSFPVIAKLQNEDASIGISEFSVIKSEKKLKARLQFLFQTYNQDVLVEEYIEGRELNVSILGDRVLPISEIKFDGLPSQYPKIITYEAKWSPESIYYKSTIPSCPAILDKNIERRIKTIALNAYNALGCRDYARVDIRLSNRNVPYVIEVNPNPDISVDSGFIRSSQAANISYDSLLNEIASYAIKRIDDDT